MPLVALALAVSFAAAADDRPAERAGSVAFVHARVFDGSGGPTIEDGTLIVRDGRIAFVGPPAAAAETLKTLPDATTIDCRGKTITPGLISDHSHVGVVAGTSVGPQNYTRENVRRQLRQYAAFGVTTINALGMNRPLFDELRAEAHRGESPGADLFGAGQGIGVSDGAPSAAVVGSADDQVFRPSAAEEARKVVRRMAERKLDMVKVWYDGNRGKLPRMDRAVFEAVIDEAHLRGLRVAAHIFELEDAKAIVAAGVDVVAHGVRDRLVDDEFVKLLRDRDVWYVPTLQLDEATFVYADAPEWTRDAFFRKALSPELERLVDDPRWRESTARSAAAVAARAALDFNQRNLKRLFDAGVKIGFGTDSGAQPLRIPGFAEHRELELYVAAGVAPRQALTIATGRAAALLKLDDRGVLATGKRADFVVVGGAPDERIEELRKIESVWREGRREAGPIAEFRP